METFGIQTDVVARTKSISIDLMYLVKTMKTKIIKLTQIILV